MKKKFISLFAILTLATTAFAQLKFGEMYTEEDFNDPSTTVTINRASWDNGGIKFEDLVETSKRYVNIKLEGAPDSLYFNMVRNQTIMGNMVFAVYESVDGTEYSKIKSWGASDVVKGQTYAIALPLKETSRYIQLCYSATRYGRISDVIVTALHPDVDLTVTDRRGVDFGNADSTDAQMDSTISISWTKLGNIQATIVGDEQGVFSVNKSEISGRYEAGSDQVIVSANPQGLEVGLYTANLVIRGEYEDYLDGRECTIPLRLLVRGDQTISWYGSTEDSTEVHIVPTFIGTVLDKATISTEKELTYESSNKDVVDYVLGLLYVKNVVGDAYVTAFQAGDEFYRPAQLTRHVFVHNETEYDTIITSVCFNEPLVIGSHSWNLQQDSVFDVDTTTFYGSTMKLHIEATVLPTYEINEIVEKSYGEPFEWNGVDYTLYDVQDEPYTDTIWEQTLAGCDSVVTLSLTIKKAAQEIFINTAEEEFLTVGGSKTIEASCTSGDEVQLSVDNSGVLELNGNVVKAIKEGDAELVAYVAETKNYLASEQVTTLFHVSSSTDMKQLKGTRNEAVKKVYRDNHIYMMVNDKMYDILGSQVK